MSEPWKRREVIGDAVLYLGDCREILPTLGVVDHIITDPPFSVRTHERHDSGAKKRRDNAERKRLNYGALTDDEAAAVAAAFAKYCHGWICWITDHTLAPVIQDALTEAGRYVFAPLPFFQPGRSVRLSGDGPCSWTDWIVCARTAAQHRWGTLPGGYVASEGWADKERMGGKPTRLMSLLVQHYSREGDMVCDPFMGACSTGIACIRERRRFVGVEIDAQTFETACRRIAAEVAAPRLDLPPPPKPKQQELL